MKQSLIIGRFQPMHLGHLYLIRKSLEESDFLIVCIGSSNKSGSENNPIKCEERERIVRKVLDSERVTNYEIVLVDDIREDGKWVEHVEQLVKEKGMVFGDENTVLFTGEDRLADKLFEKKGYIVVRTGLFNDYSATAIRKLIREGKDFSSFVPANVVDDIKKCF